MTFRERDGVAALFEVRAGDHEFADAGVAGAGEDVGEVVGVGAFAVVDAGEDGVREVDAYLFWILD